ncbi:MAG: Lrp/AsnC family transcriptional regulator [Candidatus Odinarchaeota archaeon]
MADENNHKIIELLKKDSSMTMQEIAKQLGLTRQTVHSCTKTLKKKGIIPQYTIITNDKKLGKGVTAMVLVVLDRVKRVWDLTAQELLSRGNELEVVGMYRIAGEHDVAIKIKTRSIEHWKRSCQK